MKTIILAAGEGERLRKVVDAVPKPMVKIGGKPILHHNIKWLANYGFKDIHINLYHLPDVIVSYFQNGWNHGVEITYHSEKELLGTAGSVKAIAKDWKEPFLVIYGDNLYPLEYNLSSFVNFHKGIATIGLYEKDVSESGVVVLSENGRITEFIEKPSLVNAGIYVFDREIIDCIPKGFKDFGRDIFPFLVNVTIVNSFLFKEPLIAIDTPELLREATK